VSRAPPVTAALSFFSLSSGILSPVFSHGITAYTASVPHEVESVTLTPFTAAGSSAVSVNGVSVNTGSASPAIQLLVGNNTITAVVTAQDNITTGTYTVIVTRAPSSLALLSSLTLSSGTLSPVFSSGTTDYSAAVPHDVASVTITPLSSATTSVVRVNGVMLSPGSASAGIPLAEGTNTLSVTVTAADNTTTRTYTVVISRAPSSEAALSSLSLSSGTLSPAFAPGTTAYTATVAHDVASITLTPSSTNSTSVVQVNGLSQNSGSTTAGIPLAVGNNTITILVTAEDKTSNRTYTLVVKRAFSSAAALSSLSLSTGTLSPEFASDRTSYTASVPNAVSFVTISPVRAANTMSIKVNGESIAAGATSAAIPLIVGENSISTIVRAQDDITTTTYIVVLTRAQPAPPAPPAPAAPGTPAPTATPATGTSTPPSTLAALSSISLSIGTLSPVFASETTSYTASVPHAVSSVTISPVSAAGTMTIKINGVAIASGGTSAAIPLTVGNNTVIAVVTAQDNITSTAYNIVISRASAAIPVITSFTPTVGKESAMVSITGTNLTGVTELSFGGVPAKSFTEESPSKITAVVGYGASGNISVTTPFGTAVLGGFIYNFTLPVNNFRISSTGETCINSNNGSVNITAAEALNYIATIKGDSTSKIQSFRNILELGGLAAGTYSVCITIEGRSDYKQCYQVVINRPKNLELYVSLNYFADKNSITLQMKGGTLYKLELNGVRYTTSQDQITLPVNEGNNILSVTTDNECQGLIEKKISINSSIKIYPNPFQSTLNIDLANNTTNSARVEIRNAAGKIVFSERLNNTEGQLSLNLSNLDPGIYYLMLSLDDSESMYKIMKK
jgi:hypothetical protein